MTAMRKADHEEITKRLASDSEVDEAVREGVRDALAEHRRLHNTVAIWKNGRVLVLPADQLPEDDVA